MKRNRMLALLLVLVFLAMGFYQERLKVSVNYLIDTGSVIQGYDSLEEGERALEINEIKASRNAAYDYYYSHETVKWLYNFRIGELRALKWIITAVSLVLHFLAVSCILKLWFKSRIKRFTLLIGYGAVIVLAAGVFVLGRLMGFADPAYAFTRELLGALQSLVPLMIIAPALWLKSRLSEE